jgi:hypothetical protein
LTSVSSLPIEETDSLLNNSSCDTCNSDHPIKNMEEKMKMKEKLKDE